MTEEHIEEETQKNTIDEETKKAKHGKKVTAIIIIAILMFAGTLMFFENTKPNVSETDAKFIGNNSVLYVQTGCSHCAEQEKLFGDSLKYLNVVDCLTDTDKCISANITAVPTWVINGDSYVGVKTIKELKELISLK